MYEFKNPQIKKYIALVTYGILLYLAVSHIDNVISFIGFILGVLYPVILGIGIAFVINLLVKSLENRVLTALWRKAPKIGKAKRGICVLLSFIIIIVVLSLLTVFIVPQLTKSVTLLTKMVPTYIDEATKFINQLSLKYNISDEILKTVGQNWKEIINTTTNIISSAVPYLLNFTKEFTSSIINIVLSVTLAIYLLVSKEKMISILKKVNYAFLKRRTADTIQSIAVTANKIFSNFIGGQIIEACILGSLCFLGMIVLRMPYALLISVIISITALIPILGAYIGIVPAMFILFMVSPMQALIFLIFIICLQQFEGNVIYPRVVGGSIGLGGLWVLISITIGGSLFGLIGMLVSVPTFAVIYILMRKLTYKKLEEKDIPKDLTEVK